MTYSLIARCPRTGRLGIVTASHTLAIGAYCDGAVRPNVPPVDLLYRSLDRPIQRGHCRYDHAFLAGCYHN